MTAKLTIRTSHRPYKLEMPIAHPGVWKREFDYIGEADALSLRLVKYRGVWYDVNDTERTNFAHSPFADWHCYISDTFFSGVLFKYVEGSDWEEVYCATYCS